MHGLTNTAAVRIEARSRLAANATSTYPTPGNRIFPATTWSEKSSSADGVSTPEKTTVSLTGEPKSFGFSASQFSRVGAVDREATCRLRQRDLFDRVNGLHSDLQASNAPCAIVPL